MAKKPPASPSPPPTPTRASSSAHPADSAQSFTSLKRVKELITLMTDNGLTEIELAEDKSRIVLRRGVTSAAAHPVHAAPVPLPAAVGASAPAPASAPPPQDAGLIPIKSPMVGTFYSAASPDAEPYVSVGSTVDEKSTVCIIEAMKTFNQIPSEVRGTIAKVLVSNGQLIEYGQHLFLVKP